VKGDQHLYKCSILSFIYHDSMKKMFRAPWVSIYCLKTSAELNAKNGGMRGRIKREEQHLCIHRFRDYW